jgi:hypothetical protein
MKISKVAPLFSMSFLLFLFTNLAWSLVEEGDCSIIVNENLSIFTRSKDNTMHVKWQLSDRGDLSVWSYHSGMVEWAQQGMDSLKAAVVDSISLQGSRPKVLTSFRFEIFYDRKTEKHEYMSVTKQANSSLYIKIVTQDGEYTRDGKFSDSSIYTIKSEDKQGEKSACTVTYTKDAKQFVQNFDVTNKGSGQPYDWFSMWATMNNWSTKPKGICFFDIDGTLEQDADRDKNLKVIDACRKNGFFVGVITSRGIRDRDGTYTVSKFCSKGGDEERFVSDELCAMMLENHSRMFNSFDIRSGQPMPDGSFHTLVADAGWRYGESAATVVSGALKAYKAHYWRDTYYPSMPDQCVILFDDDSNIKAGYASYNEGYRRYPGYTIDTKTHNFSFYQTNGGNKATRLYATNVEATVKGLAGCDKEIDPAGKPGEPKEQKEEKKYPND